MYQCARLFRAESVAAYYAAAQKHVVIVADVWLNPYADDVHLCPNLIAMPRGAHEFIVEGTTRPGIHPQLVVKHRVSYSYASDLTPQSVIVYSMGIDAPARQEVPVGSAPPPPLEHTLSAEAASPPAAADVKPTTVEVVGFSQNFSFEEAIGDALNQARAKFPSPPRNPDVGVTVEVQKIEASALGNIRPGLLLTCSAK
jgi:hypothetical protein